MMYILCTAEKPSVAGDIARAIGAGKRCNGYFEGNGYRVTWAVGHLVGLCEPEEYGYMSQDNMWDKSHPENRKTALQELPLIPQQFKLRVLDQTKEQFAIMAALMNDPECDYIIDCGDAGPEGHILQWFIRVMAGCRKPVKRFIAVSMTNEAILDAMANLQPIEKYMPIIQGEYCKKKADWIMGMSMSRAESIIYNAKVDVGRVQSPTLYFVVKRFLDNTNFKPKDFYGLRANMQGGYAVTWQKDVQGIFPIESIDEEKRLLDKELAQKTVAAITEGGKGTVSVFETKKKATDRPQLYDITELERDGNRIFSYTAEQVLQAAQSLYEKHKITTYPRTDSRYITHDLAPLMMDRIKDISQQSRYRELCEQLIQTGLNLDQRIVDDSKVSDHHAIIVTDKIRLYDVSKLTEIEQNILNLVITRMLVAFSGKYKYKETILNITFSNGMIFSAKGEVPVEQGWKKVQAALDGKEYKELEQEEDIQTFPDLQVGQQVILDTAEVISKKTTAPRLHTEATLLTAMENAGATIEGGEILKGKGIGTQSTRANIIKSLFDKGYIINKTQGKTNYLVPTKQGVSVIKVLPAELYSPKITADWEKQIAGIVDGTISEKDFMADFERFIKNEIEYVTTHKKENVDFSIEREAVAMCPWCHSNMYQGEYERDNKKIKSVYCSNKDCRCSVRFDDMIFKSRTGKSFTLTQIKGLLKQGFIETTAKNKQGNPYKAIFSLTQNDKGYATIECSLPKFKK